MATIYDGHAYFSVAVFVGIQLHHVFACLILYVQDATGFIRTQCHLRLTGLIVYAQDATVFIRIQLHPLLAGIVHNE